MITLMIFLTVQSVMGGLDNLWHHELQARLPSQPGARKELALHSVRELIYGLIYIGIAWWSWNGTWVWLLIALLVMEVVITLWDFIEEDRSRPLPPFERVLHTLLSINYGVLLVLLAAPLQEWAHAPTAISPVDYGGWSWLMTLFGCGLLAWGLRNLFAVARLGVPQWQHDPVRAQHKASAREVLVTGATGFVGRALVRALVERGERVIALSRHPEIARDQFGPHVEVVDDLARLASSRRIDTLFNLAGEPIAGGPWTRRRKQRLVDSRVAMAARVGALIARLERAPEVLINASAIGYYGDRADAILCEDDTPGSGFLAEVCGQWEAAAERAGTRGVRVCRIRIGLVLGPGGGLLQPLALAARFGAATVLGDGRQWQSWIHLDDLVRLLLHAMDRTSMRGAINAVAPEAVTQRVFTQRLAETLHRPAWLRVPARFLHALPGGMSELFLGSQRIEPRVALAQDFRFRHPRLDGALRAILVPAPSKATTVAVYVNDACPVCHAEMDRYRAASQREHRGITFCSIDSGFPGLPAYGLTADDLRRRLFVYTSDGRLRSGMDAMRAIWRDLPSLRWLAWISGLPGFRQLADLIYDLVLAPALDAWNRRRAAASTPSVTATHPP